MINHQYDFVFFNHQWVWTSLRTRSISRCAYTLMDVPFYFVMRGWMVLEWRKRSRHGDGTRDSDFFLPFDWNDLWHWGPIKLPAMTELHAHHLCDGIEWNNGINENPRKDDGNQNSFLVIRSDLLHMHLLLLRSQEWLEVRSELQEPIW